MDTAITEGVSCYAIVEYDAPPIESASLTRESSSRGGQGCCHPAHRGAGRDVCGSGPEGPKPFPCAC
jgi:hypothetical protein